MSALLLLLSLCPNQADISCVYISGYEKPKPIEVKVGAVLVFSPFTYNLNANTESVVLDCQVKSKLPVLEFIGTGGYFPTHQLGEGKGSQCAYLVAREEGQVEVRMRLADKGNFLKGYDVTYKVWVK